MSQYYTWNLYIDELCSQIHTAQIKPSKKSFKKEVRFLIDNHKEIRLEQILKLHKALNYLDFTN